MTDNNRDDSIKKPWIVERSGRTCLRDDWHFFFRNGRVLFFSCRVDFLPMRNRISSRHVDHRRYESGVARGEGKKGTEPAYS